LGFRDLISFNQAMLGKQAWRLIQQPLSLWGKFFRGLYFHSSTFFKAVKGSHPSWGWQSLLSGREAILTNVRWSVGDGKCINIREDRWLPMGILGGPKAPKEPLLVDDLIDQSTSSWKIDLLHKFFDLPIIQQITDIQIRPTFTKDALIWTTTNKGTFSNQHIMQSLRQNQVFQQLVLLHRIKFLLGFGAIYGRCLLLLRSASFSGPYAATP